MKNRLILACLAAFAAALIAAPAVLAASPGVGKPTIRIVSPQASTVTGSTVTLRVAVSHFKLVPPVYLNPPRLSGNQGHIHYVLDSLSNFVATRDATISLSHTWSNVSPGRHTLIAYLATSQHAMFPGTQQVTLPVTVEATSAGAHTRTTALRSAAKTTRKGLGITAMPKTGGAADAGRSWPGLTWLLLGLAAAGLVAASRRMLLAQISKL